MPRDTLSGIVGLRNWNGTWGGWSFGRERTQWECNATESSEAAISYRGDDRYCLEISCNCRSTTVFTWSLVPFSNYLDSRGRTVSYQLSLLPASIFLFLSRVLTLCTIKFFIIQRSCSFCIGCSAFKWTELRLRTLHEQGSTQQPLGNTGSGTNQIGNHKLYYTSWLKLQVSQLMLKA